MFSRFFQLVLSYHKTTGCGAGQLRNGIDCGEVVRFCFMLLLLVPFMGCEMFQSNKKPTLVETPPYYHSQNYQPRTNTQHNNIDESKIFHQSDSDKMASDVRVFRERELEKLQRESIALDKVQDYNQNQNQDKNTSPNKTEKKGWFATWFGGNSKNKESQNPAKDDPYLMSDKGRKISSNLK
jgi:hypothetical protein